ncbi:histone-lysine N-methyltransferase 2A [Trichomycterus rosablanca]|uniref:histone-lysine N-methyltransferase 2A n=1 Tax=Trichomycterus rosablanca TaxID=2290929 RepID=UPI002F352958
MAAVAATAAAVTAAGCGSVAAAACGGAGVPGGVAAARGRFPGRPWTSRSRLRSEKRWQLGRSVTELDELGGGGLRPGCLAFACGEDQPYMRLLGIEASYNCLGEAGYSSSASEEGSEFRGFEAENHGSIVQEQKRRKPPKRNRAFVRVTKRKRRRPAPIAATDVQKSQMPENDLESTQQPHSEESPNAALTKDSGPGSVKLAKPRRRRGTAKELVSSAPRITIKLVTKRRIRGASTQQSQSKENQCAIVSFAQVKLKRGETCADTNSAVVKKEVFSRRRGRSASVPSSVPDTKVDYQKLEDNLRKSARKTRSASCQQNTEKNETEATDSSSKEKTELNKLVIRRWQRKDLVQQSGDFNNEGSLSDSVLEVSTVEEHKPPSRKKKKKRKKKHRKEKSNREADGTLSEKPPSGSTDVLSKEFVEIPRLKLKRIRNPKRRSRKKCSKFIWTLSLIKSKGKIPQTQENLSKTPESLNQKTGSPSTCAKEPDVSTETTSSLGDKSENEECTESFLKTPKDAGIKNAEETSRNDEATSVEDTENPRTDEKKKTRKDDEVNLLKEKKVKSNDAEVALAKEDGLTSSKIRETRLRKHVEVFSKTDGNTTSEKDCEVTLKNDKEVRPSDVEVTSINVRETRLRKVGGTALKKNEEVTSDREVAPAKIRQARVRKNSAVSLSKSDQSRSDDEVVPRKNHGARLRKDDVVTSGINEKLSFNNSVVTPRNIREARIKKRSGLTSENKETSSNKNNLAPGNSQCENLGMDDAAILKNDEARLIDNKLDPQKNQETILRKDCEVTSKNEKAITDENEVTPSKNQVRLEINERLTSEKNEVRSNNNKEVTPIKNRRARSRKDGGVTPVKNAQASSNNSEITPKKNQCVRLRKDGGVTSGNNENVRPNTQVSPRKDEVKSPVGSEVVKEMHRDEVTQSDFDLGEDFVPPFQIKVVSSPGKESSLTQSFLIQQVTTTPKPKEVPTGADQSPAEIENLKDTNGFLMLKVKPRLNRNIARKKRTRHRPWTAYRRKSTNTSSGNHDSKVTGETIDLASSTETPTTKTKPKTGELPASCEQHNLRKCSGQAVVSKTKMSLPVCEATLPEATGPTSVDCAALQPRQITETPSDTKLSAKDAASIEVVLSAKEMSLSTEALLPSEVSLAKEAPSSEKLSSAVELHSPEPTLQTKQVLSAEWALPVEQASMGEQTSSTAEVLVLEPPVPDQGQSPHKIPNSKNKQSKKRRRNLIGQRLKVRRKRLLSKPSTKGEGDDSSTVVSPDSARSKLVGILKTKYRSQQVSSSLPNSLEERRRRAKLFAQQVERDLRFHSNDQPEKTSEIEEKDLTTPEAQPGKTKFVKNIKHFIMPVVSARSSRVIKTPKRFMDDADMSDLPRRKKGQQLALNPKSKKRDSGEKEEPVSLPVSDHDDIVHKAHLDLDLSSAEDSKFEPLLDDLVNLGEEKSPDKRRSLLREPDFNWQVLEPAGADLFDFDPDFEKECEALLSAKDFPFDSLIDPPQTKKPCMKFKKQTSDLKLYKKLRDNLNYGPKRKTQQKIPSGEARKDVLPFAEEKREDVEKEDSLIQPLSDIKKEKAKLKIEDLDTPGVVRKVSICVRALGSKLLAQHQEEQVDEMPDEFSIHTDISLPKKTLDMDKLFLAESGEKKAGRLDQKRKTDAIVSKEKGVFQRPHLTGANKRMFNLLKKAKVQLIKIDQQKQLKSSGLLPEGVMTAAKRRISKAKASVEGTCPIKPDVPPEQEPSRGGPRIKHVCRAAAVVLGQPRAMIPDDIPRLSALPLHERLGISPSPTTKDVESHSDPDSPHIQDQRTPKFRKGSRAHGNRSSKRRCGECKGCLHEEDCGKCVNCLDKPKFGGPNTKRQCCVFKRCDMVEERKAIRLGKLHKGQIKRHRSSVSAGHSSNEEGEVTEGASAGDSQSPSLRKQPKRTVKPRYYCDLLEYDSDLETNVNKTPNSISPARRRVPGSRNADFVSLEDFVGDGLDDGIRQRKPGLHRVPTIRRKPEKSTSEQTPPSVLAALANGFAQRTKELSEPTYKIRIDFKEDFSLQSLWSTGGMSILTSVPLMPPSVCLLCASKGQHEMLYCQVCCEPFHLFCLEPSERPEEENKENWCCPCCKSCRVCGRKNKHSKPLLECERCQNCYHPACLGPNYPKPNKRKRTLVCMTCIRCKSCGVTPGKTWDTEWNLDKGFCPDCTRLYDQGNYCTMCFKCYEDNDYESQMMQCSICNHWVHAKCEGLTDDLYEILSSLPESVVYSCQPCTQAQPGAAQESEAGGGWRELLQMELRAGVEKVLACLLSSTLTQHLVTCKECAALCDPAGGDDEVEEELPICDLRAVGKKFDNGHYSTLKSFHEDVVRVVRRKLEEEETLPEDQRPTALARSYYLKLMEEVFSWFNSQDPKVWDPRSKHLPAGMLSHAVVPPTNEHIFAQWREREKSRSLNSTMPAVRGHSEVKGEDEADLSTSPLYRPVSTHEDLGLHYKPTGKKSQGSKEDLDTGWSKEDERQCVLCQKYGDAKSSDAGRLLYLGQNEWAHVNCSMWSAEVFEENNGCLMHVHSAVARGRLMRCERCNQTGATVGCCLTSCQSNYHFMCARSRNCVFQDDKKVFCYKHRNLISGKIITGQGFEVLRRVFVDFEGISLRRKFLTGLEPEYINIMIGSLQVCRLGKLNELSVSQGKLFPVGYECSRWYWSTINPRRRCKYTCRVLEVRPPVQEKPVEDLPELGDNRTIAHSPCSQTEPETAEDMTPLTPSSVSPFAKPDHNSRPKVSGYPLNRRPAGGLYRPLPSPGVAPSKSHHILTISDLEDARRPRRNNPHLQNTGIRRQPPTGSAGCSHHSKTTQLTSPVFPHGATDNLLTSSSARPVGRSASFSRGPGILAPHSTSGLFPEPMWHDGAGSTPFSNQSLSSPTPPSRPRLPFDLNLLDSPELPHNLMASPQELPAANGTSLFRDAVDSEKGQTEKEFPYTPFQLDSDLSVVSELKSELEIEATVLNEGVAEGDENQEEFWDQDMEVPAGRLPLAADTCAEDWGNSSSDEDMGNYFDFSRTVVTCKGSRDTSKSPASSRRSISQLDGVDDGTESDTSVSSSSTQNLKKLTQKPPQSLDLGQSHKQITSNGLCAELPRERFGSLSLSGTTDQNSSNPVCFDAYQNTDFIAQTFESSSLVPLQETSINTVVPKDMDSTYSEFTADLRLPLILDRCDPPSPSTCFTELLPVKDDSHFDTPETVNTKEIYLDHNSGHFVSFLDGSTIYSNNLSDGTSEVSMPDSFKSIKESVSAAPTSSSNSNSTSSSKITSYPIQPHDSKTVLPPMESFTNKNPPLDAGSHVQSVPSGAMCANSSSQPDLNLPLSLGSSVSFASIGSVCGSVYPANTQPVATATVSIVPSATSQTSVQCHSVPSIIQPVSGPLVVNGYSSLPVQADGASGHTISINFANPRPTMDPQQQVTQALPGHAILTVKEVGGPNVDPTPHVLLVNRLGQIFVKNPKSNTFQLPSPNSPSYNCVTQIASLLQSNTLSATLAAAGNLPTVSGATIPAQVPALGAPVVQTSNTITQLLTSNGKETTTPPEVKKSKRNTKDSTDNTGVKKSRTKKESLTSSKTKSVIKPGSADNHAESAQAIINQAMAGYYDPKRNAGKVLSPFARPQSQSSIVTPPALKSETSDSPPSTPQSASSRPKQVRIKRVSTFSERVAIKKSKSDFVEPELSSGPEEQHMLSSAAARCGGVRIKAPSVKGVLDLDKLNEEQSSDSESTRPGLWECLSGSRCGDNGKPQSWDATGCSSLSDWNKYSGMMSCSDDEASVPESKEECPPRGDQPHLRFEICSDDGFSVEADSIEVAWRAVIDGVQEARAAASLRQLSFTGISGARMMGLLHDAVVYLVEQLQGAKSCYRHTFRFHRQPSQEDDLPINPSGCSRSEVYLRKSTFDMFNFLASQHRQLPDTDLYDEEEDDVLLKSSRRATSLELPMAMRFRHLERTSKEAVGVYRSAIHGRGLFCKRNIEAGEMVIEYSGIVIRSVLTDKREKYYDGKGIGCYMFRIDDFDVVDATMHGNAARFINHSCEPNCYSRVINVEGQKHIVIFALRKIYRGEELTYDYKFPIEDASNKLGCNCGAKRCRRFLN